MNHVQLIGRIANDLEVRYTQSNMAILNFSLAVNRPVKQDEDKKADFPRIICFGKQAENLEKYQGKGRLIGVHGRIQTGSYEKDGVRHYTTEVVADNIEYLEFGDKQGSQSGQSNSQTEPVEGFHEIEDEDLPF